MSELPAGPMTDSATWTPSDVPGLGPWQHRVDGTELREVEHALAVARASGREAARIETKDFPLAALASRLGSLRADVESGRGFALLRGLPVDGLDPADGKMLCRGLGLHLGEPISQNSRGDRIVAITGTPVALPAHTDGGDLTALLCIRAAAQGGTTRLASGAAIYNEIRRQRPDLMERLAVGYHHDLGGNGPTGRHDEVSRHPIPVFSFCDDRLACCFDPRAIRAAALKTGRSLEPIDRAAIALVEELAASPQFRFDVDLRPGDLLLFANHAVLHGRTAISDAAANSSRLLLRLWLNTATGRPVVPSVSDRFNTGPRRGVAVRSAAAAIMGALKAPRVFPL